MNSIEYTTGTLNSKNETMPTRKKKQYCRCEKKKRHFDITFSCAEKTFKLCGLREEEGRRIEGNGESDMCCRPRIAAWRTSHPSLWGATNASPLSLPPSSSRSVAVRVGNVPNAICILRITSIELKSLRQRRTSGWAVGRWSKFVRRLRRSSTKKHFCQVGDHRKLAGTHPPPYLYVRV